MQRFFLYKLFKHSKAGFTFVVLFLLCYSIFFLKRIDSIFFPYNSMFTIDFTKKSIATVYSVKLNNTAIKITHQPYWKKDFLEESLINYAKYKKNNNTGFIDTYLDAKINNTEKRRFLLQRLSPDKKDTDHWLSWYIKFAGYQLTAPSTIEILQYDVIYENNIAVLTDSICIYKTSAL